MIDRASKSDFQYARVSKTAKFVFATFSVFKLPRFPFTMYQLIVILKDFTFSREKLLLQFFDLCLSNSVLNCINDISFLGLTHLRPTNY